MNVARKQDARMYAKKRRHIRYPPDRNALARIKLLDHEGRPEGANIVGLAIDESYEGCSVVLRATPELKVGRNCLVAVGALLPLPGKIVWMRDLEPNVVRIGIALTE